MSRQRNDFHSFVFITIIALIKSGARLANYSMELPGSFRSNYDIKVCVRTRLSRGFDVIICAKFYCRLDAVGWFISLGPSPFGGRHWINCVNKSTAASKPFSFLHLHAFLLQLFPIKKFIQSARKIRRENFFRSIRKICFCSFSSVTHRKSISRLVVESFHMQQWCRLGCFEHDSLTHRSLAHLTLKLVAFLKIAAENVRRKLADERKMLRTRNPFSVEFSSCSMLVHVPSSVCD